MSAPIRIVLVGFGKMGHHHFRAITESQRFELVGIVDPMGGGEPSNIPMVAHLEELSDVEFSCAIVATPTPSHFDIVLQLLRMGKHVLVEKPAASQMEQARELVALASSMKLKLCVGNIERCNPAVLALKEAVVSKAMGKLLVMKSHRAGGRPLAQSPENNVILDLVVHDLDVMASLLGGSDRLSFQAGNGYCGDTGIIEVADLLGRSVLGVDVSLHGSWRSPVRERWLQVVGSLGVCRVNYMTQECVVWGQHLERIWPGKKTLKEGAFQKMVLSPGPTMVQPIQEQLDQFWLFLNERQHCLCYGRELLLVQELIADVCATL